MYVRIAIQIKLHYSKCLQSIDCIWWYCVARKSRISDSFKLLPFSNMGLHAHFAHVQSLCTVSVKNQFSSRAKLIEKASHPRKSALGEGVSLNMRWQAMACRSKQVLIEQWTGTQRRRRASSQFRNARPPASKCGKSIFKRFIWGRDFVTYFSFKEFPVIIKWIKVSELARQSRRRLLGQVQVSTIIHTLSC